MRYLVIVLLMTSGCLCWCPVHGAVSRKKGVVGHKTTPGLSFQNLFLARQIALNEKFRAQDAGIVFPENSAGGFDDDLEQMGAARRLLQIKKPCDRKKREEERRRAVVSLPKTTYEKVQRQLRERLDAQRDREQLDAQRDRELLDARQDRELLDILRDRELFDVLRRKVTTDDLQDVF